MPVRQFVLSLPYELRLLAAFEPDVLAAIARIFVEVVFASYRACPCRALSAMVDIRARLACGVVAVWGLLTSTLPHI